MTRQLFAFAALALFTVPRAASAEAPPAPRYTVTDLGTLPGGLESAAYGLNDRGQVVGWSDGGADPAPRGPEMVHNHAVLWDHGKVLDLGLLKGFPYSAGWGINNHGQVAGGWDLNYYPGGGGGPAGLVQTFLWQNGQRTIIGAVSPTHLSRISGINDSGQIAGTFDWDAKQRAALWSKNKLTTLPLPSGFDNSYAYGLNSAGMVAGSARRDKKNGSEYHAFLWRGGTAVDLGTLSPGSPLTEAYAINDRGQIIGATSGRGFLWQSGKMREIPPLTPAFMRPNGINNRSQVVGTVDGVSPGHRVFLWQNDVTYDLNALIPKDAGWVLEDAYAINAKGQIVGWGEHGGHKRAFLLTPITAHLSKLKKVK